MSTSTTRGRRLGSRFRIAAALIALSVSASSSGCRRGERAASPQAEEVRGVEADASEPDAEAASEPEAALHRCVRQGRADLGAPVHRERGGGGGFVRLDQCVRVSVIEADDRWARVAFPMTGDRTEGWLSTRYLMGCEPCETPEAGAEGGDAPWPPRPQGLCLDAAATGRERLTVAEASRASAGGGARGRPGVTVKVLSYNVWELYDGQGGDQYLASEEAHGGSPASHFEARLALLAGALSAQEVDLLLLQEVESAEVACALAARAWPRSGWSCAATGVGGRSPQNIALATRLAGTPRWLRPAARRETGPRGALELSLEGAGGLTITTVHLKSSRGREGREDCDNARQRMGAAAALADRYRRWPSVLIAGDFNVDPMDGSRQPYDRTDDILASRGFERLCPAEGCQRPTYHWGPASPAGQGSAIDLGFFHGGGLWRSEAIEVIASAPERRRNPLGSDHLPLLITLRR